MIILLITIFICNSVLSRRGKREHYFTTQAGSLIRALTPRSNEKHNLKPALRAFSGMYGFRRCGRHQAKHLTTRVWRMWLNKDKQEIQ
ncbi:hypothetical protein EVX99_14030 [Citrobacter koseri]|nr:hypothetical protein EVX99_14030 [Citrobacter koseri]